jgi:hypothetical protein
LLLERACAARHLEAVAIEDKDRPSLGLVMKVEVEAAGRRAARPHLRGDGVLTVAALELSLALVRREGLPPKLAIVRTLALRAFTRRR